MSVRFGIAGAGVIGAAHAAAIAEVPGARLMAVTDPVAGRAAMLAAAHGASVCSDLAELYARRDVDAVAICLPSGAHATATVAAVGAGKHVLVEKPADITLDAIDTMIAARDASGLLVAPVSQHRFDPAALVVHEAVAVGRLGTLTSGDAAVTWWRGQDYYDSGDWRGTWALDGGGALMNQSIHTIDLLCWLLGAPVEVFAFAATLAHERIEVEDTAVAAVRFVSGALATVSGTTAAYPGLTARLRVHGTLGSAIIDNDRLVFLHPRTGESAGRAEPTGAGADPAALSGAHALQYTDFVTAVTRGARPAVTLEDNRCAVELILAIYRSASTGAPVLIDPY